MSGIDTVFKGAKKRIFQNLTYLPFSGPSALSVANGGAVSNTFDLDGRMTQANPGVSNPRRQYLEYLSTGHLERINSPEITWASRRYEYDDLYRLTQAIGPYGTIDYTYDNTGNRLSMQRTNGQPVQDETYSYYAGKNRLQAITGTRNVSYSYNVRGYASAAGDRTMGYNADGRMIWVKEDGVDLGRYFYNGMRQRTKKIANGNTTLYLYDFDGNLIVEADEEGTTRKEYLYHGNSRLAMAFASGNVCFMHNNRFGAPELITNSSNTVVWEAIYKPFGEASVNSRSMVANNFRFQGQYFDGETGWHYNHYRYYDPKSGRYLSPDPIGLAGGINPYAYVSNDPINRIDPLGLDPLDPSSGKANPVLRCHVCPHDDPTENAIGAALLVVSPVVGLLAAEAYSGVATVGLAARLLPMATQLYRNGPLTNAGRALTKYPNVIGECGNILQKLGGAGNVNAAAAKALQNIIENGAITISTHPEFGKIIDYKLPSGIGARFSVATHEFIGFLGRGL